MIRSGNELHKPTQKKSTLRHDSFCAEILMARMKVNCNVQQTNDIFDKKGRIYLRSILFLRFIHLHALLESRNLGRANGLKGNAMLATWRNDTVKDRAHSWEENKSFWIMDEKHLPSLSLLLCAIFYLNRIKLWITLRNISALISPQYFLMTIVIWLLAIDFSEISFASRVQGKLHWCIRQIFSVVEQNWGQGIQAVKAHISKNHRARKFSPRSF